MPQLNNKEILECILKSAVGVLSRRTSESYANVVVSNSLKKLAEKYSFLKLVEIDRVEYSEFSGSVTVGLEINDIEAEKIGKVITELIVEITNFMGKSAGFYFIREIKESLSYTYEKTINEIGVDLDFLQLEFITSVKEALRYKIENSDILKYVFMVLFEILDKEIGGESAYKNLNEVVRRFSIEYELLDYVKINDIRAIQGIDAVMVGLEVNNEEPAKVGAAIQKCIQELNNNLSGTSIISFMDKLKNQLNLDYLFKLDSIGVNLDVIQFGPILVIKNVLKALVDILSSYSSESYAILVINNSLRKYEDKFQYLKLVKIDSAHLTDGINAIDVSPEIVSFRSSELGRGLQRVIEDISKSLGEDASRYFVDGFRNRLGRAYVLKIEELGVNLHMIELRRNIAW